ncbi:hypothetical protein C8J57DRAFT_1287512 [Mycena rebaudengoi]|nr:hypothetical protein C8J57DRAFT_1287512 [Mycena rebaudengoi]
MSTPTMIIPRVALVTGAARGLGRAIALRLALDGLDVVVNDVPASAEHLDEVVKEIEAIGRRAVAFVADVSVEDQVKSMVDSTVTKLGRLDVMIANAGVGAGMSDILTANIEHWEKCWKVNIRGTILSYKYAAIQMVKQGDGGRIIGASSICGMRGFAHIGAYCISKASVRSLTQTAAQELREHRITVNAYAPGVIQTDMTAIPGDEDNGGAGSLLKQVMNISHVRTGQPADVAALVSFLASPESHFVTGQTISVDDGAYFS